MNEKEKFFSPEDLENKKMPPFPGGQDLVLLDGQFMQCVRADGIGGVTFYHISDKSKLVHISPEEWTQYEYTAPEIGAEYAGELVEKGLMTSEQLAQVYWGLNEKEYPYLKGLVTFFGTFTKKK